MPLTEMYKTMLEAGNPATWETNRQKQLMGEYELESKRRAMEAEQQLRNLYAQNPNPSFGAAAAIDPAYAQKMQQFQNEQLAQQYNMLKAQGDIEENQRKSKEAKQHTFANTLGVGVENWIDSLGGRQPTQADIEAFKPKLGNLLKFIDETYGYKPDVPIDPYHPEQILSTAESLGYSSRRAKTQQEMQLRNIPPTPTAQQAYGEVESTPYGYKVRPPLPGAGRLPRGTGMGGAPAAQIPEGYQRATIQDLPALEQEYANATDANQKQMIGSLINQLKQQTQATSGQFITPEQESKLRIQEEQQKKDIETAAAGQRKSAELGAESAEETAKKAQTMVVLPSDEEVYSLIKKSLSGKISEAVKKTAASETFGLSTEANTATSELISIQEQLRGVVKALYTPGAITEDEQKKMQAAIGAIAEAKDPDSRIAGYRRFMDMARKSIVNHPELASEVERITGSKILSPRRKLNVGDTVGTGADAMRYKGGNPYNRDNWEGVK